MADWRAMGNSLSNWLTDKKEQAKSVPPPAHQIADRPPMGIMPKGTKQAEAQGAKPATISHGGGPGQTRYDYSDGR